LYSVSKCATAPEKGTWPTVVLKKIRAYNVSKFDLTGYIY